MKVLLSITDKILDRMPTYDQRKKAEYFKLKKLYLDELARVYPNRDDNLVDVYRRDLMLKFSEIDSTLQGAKISNV